MSRTLAGGLMILEVVDVALGLTGEKVNPDGDKEVKD